MEKIPKAHSIFAFAGWTSRGKGFCYKTLRNPPRGIPRAVSSMSDFFRCQPRGGRVSDVRFDFDHLRSVWSGAFRILERMFGWTYPPDMGVISTAPPINWPLKERGKTVVFLNPQKKVES